MRANVRIAKEEPMCAKPSTDTDDAIREMLRSDKEAPRPK
jgi:hypothetical protein